jgi:hypothetical protein
MSDYKKLFEGFKNFIKEEEINEVTEEELVDIEQVLNDLKPSDLPFGDIFGDKMRLIEPMGTQDENLDYLKNILGRSGYEPDFSTGRATYYVVNIPGGFDREGNPQKPSTMILTGQQVKDVTQKKDDETLEKFKERMKIIQKKEVKIGKLLQKGGRLFDIAKKSYNEFEKVNPTDYPKDEYAQYRQKSMDLEDKLDKARGKLQDTFPDFTSQPVADINPFQKLASWWNKKSTYYRENPEAAASGESTGEYSIVYTRHPIDVLRMSDFDNIESCHSPRSRGGGATYYKCAVAEAHGEGAVAYVVKNSTLDRLKGEWGAESVQDLLDKFQEADEEFFEDTERGTGEITPLSRIRLKQYRNPSAEVSLAVPEERIYGRRWPSFRKTVTQWAKDTQAKEIKKLEATKNSDNPYENAFDKEGALNLRNWERYGGSYQDTSDSALFHNLLGYQTVGSARIDSTTEDNLEINSNVAAEWEVAIRDLVEHWNGRYQAIEVSGEVEDHDEEAYISVSARYIIKIDEDEFVHSAFQEKTRNAIESIPEYLRNYGYDWLDDYIRYTVDGGAVVMEIPIDMEDMNPDGGGGVAYDPDNFTEICIALDQRDDMADAIIETAKGALKREGILEGAALIELARALEDESWYEWDYQIDDDWDPTSIEVETKTYVNFNELIKQIPVKFTTQLKVPTQDFTAELHGSQIATIETWEREGGVRAYRVLSNELGGDSERDTGTEVANKAAALEYIQWEVSKLILRPEGNWPAQISRSRYKSSRDFNLAIRNLMREEAGGTAGEFAYPNSETWVGGPDADDEYKVEYSMQLTDSDPDEVVKNAHKIIVETDDEDIQRNIFLKAFAQVLKLPGASVNETRKYFNKFNIF